MRLAIISSPRAGNSWLREVLALAYDLEMRAVHDPSELGPALPARAVVQLHWDRTPEFVRYLQEQGVRVMSMARHPLDTLVSMLHFARFEPQVAHWLGGDYLAAVVGASPTSEAFERFALGPGAGRLLAVTPQWWSAPGTLQVRYETMRADPGATLQALADQLGEVPTLPLASALAARQLELFKSTPNRHAWRAEPGLWRRVVTPELAGRIRRAHPVPFAVLGYLCDPDPTLTPERAEAAWNELKA